MIFVGSMLIALHIDIVIKKDNLGFNPLRGGGGGDLNLPNLPRISNKPLKKIMQTHKEGETCH